MASASYNLFLELAKVIGATRMMELCELYIARNREPQPQLADASGQRFWRDCSGDAIYPPAWTLETTTAAGIPGAPKKAKQAFQSPFLAATPPPEDSPARRLSFTSLDDMPPLESYGAPLAAPQGAALCHTANSRGEYSWYSGLAGLPTTSE
jgi:hypothetical protein